MTAWVFPSHQLDKKHCNTWDLLGVSPCMENTGSMVKPENTIDALQAQALHLSRNGGIAKPGIFSVWLDWKHCRTWAMSPFIIGSAANLWLSLCTHWDIPWDSPFIHRAASGPGFVHWKTAWISFDWHHWKPGASNIKQTRNHKAMDSSAHATNGCNARAANMTLLRELDEETWNTGVSGSVWGLCRMSCRRQCIKGWHLHTDYIHELLSNWLAIMTCQRYGDPSYNNRSRTHTQEHCPNEKWNRHAHKLHCSKSFRNICTMVASSMILVILQEVVAQNLHLWK